MMASLRAVSELQNPAIKDRHWHQLMAETNVTIYKKSFLIISTPPIISAKNCTSEK